MAPRPCGEAPSRPGERRTAISRGGPIRAEGGAANLARGRGFRRDELARRDGVLLAGLSTGAPRDTTDDPAS